MIEFILIDFQFKQGNNNPGWMIDVRESKRDQCHFLAGLRNSEVAGFQGKILKGNRHGLLEKFFIVYMQSSA